MVVNQELDGFIGTLATVGYSIQKNFATELKVAGKFDERWQLGIATRNDEPLLHDIFEKVIATITRNEHQAILNRWIAIKYVKGVDYTVIWITLAVIALVLILLLWRFTLLRRYNINLALFAEELPENIKKLLLEVEKASLRAKDLTGQLLTFAKGGAPVIETASLDDVIRDSANFVPHGGKVLCKFDLPDRVPQSEEILAINPGAKIIVSSGYSNDPVMARFADFGFCAALVKPFKLQGLALVIDEITG